MDGAPQMVAIFARELLAAVNTQHTYRSGLSQLRQWHKRQKHPDASLDDTVQTVSECIKPSLSTEPSHAPAFAIEELK